jgi:hypothetical protein
MSMVERLADAQQSAPRLTRSCLGGSGWVFLQHNDVTDQHNHSTKKHGTDRRPP